MLPPAKRGPVMAYTAEQIAQAARRQAFVAQIRPEARRLKDGELTMQVEPVLFHNARIENKRVYGVENIWDEPEFRRDMARRHPEIRVRSRGGIRVGGRGVGPAAAGRLTRFGRVTEHRVYR